MTSKSSNPAFRKGFYETNYGNAAYVSGPKAKTAKDLDAGEVIPISMVTEKWLRAANPGEGSWIKATNRLW